MPLDQPIGGFLIRVDPRTVQLRQLADWHNIIVRGSPTEVAQELRKIAAFLDGIASQRLY